MHTLPVYAAVQSFGVLGSSPAGALEIEGEPGISLTLAALPGVELSVMHTLRSTVPTEGKHQRHGCSSGCVKAWRAHFLIAHNQVVLVARLQQ